MKQQQQACLIPIAFGTEELEAVTVIDVLRRAKIRVIVCKVNSDDDENKDSLIVKCSRGTKIVCDMHLSDALKLDYNSIALPG